MIDWRIVSGSHQVARLHRPLKALTHFAQTSNRVGWNSAIGIDEEDEVRRIVADMIDRPTQGISLAYPLKIISHKNFGSRSSGDRGRIVGAIVGHDYQTIA